MSESSMPWIKVYTKMLDDPKLGRVSERVRWRWVQLLMMAGDCDAEGYFVSSGHPMSTDDIAWRLRLDSGKLAQDMASLTNIGVIENTDKGWFIPKFAELQGRSQTQKREVWRRNQRQKRDKQSGPEWKTEENAEKLKPVINDTDMTHTPRGEESRGEKRIHTGAHPAPDAPTLPDPLKELAQMFEDASGIHISSIPKKSQGALYWNPLRLMLKTGNGSAPEEMRAAVSHLRKAGMTISDPNSILKTFNSIHGEHIAAPATTFTEYSS